MKRALSALILTMLPLSAFASEWTWTVYGYANGYVLVDVFKAITMWLTSSDFKYFVMAIATLGLLGASIMGFVGGNVRTIGSYIMALMVGVYLMFSVTVDVVVEDMVYGKGGNDTVPMTSLVQGVPAAAALPLAIISEVGFIIASEIETVFASTNSSGIGSYPSMSEGTPFGGTYGVMYDLGKSTIRDARLRSNITNYMRYCFVPYLNNDWYSTKEIVEANNFWKAVGETGRGAPVNQYIPYVSDSDARDLLSCPQAHSRIEGDLSIYLPELLGSFTGAGQLVSGSNMGAATTIGEWAMGAADEATNMAVNSAMLEMTRSGFQQAAAALGADSLMVALNTENARRAQVSGWYTTAILFRDMASYFFAILQAFVIALTAIVLILAFIPSMGFKIMGGYAKVIVWLMLWWPGLAVVNYIMNSYYVRQINVFGGACASDAATCVASLGLTNDMTQNMMIAAGLMATFVPAIMWGIVSQGSFALTSVLDRASGTGYATQAGSSIAHGDASFGNIRMNNASMNKHDVSVANTTGMSGSVFHSGAGAVIRNEQAGSTHSIQGSQMDSITMGQVYEANHQKHAAKTAAVSQVAQDNYSTAQSQLAEKAVSLLDGHARVENGQLVFDSSESRDAFMALAHNSQDLLEHSNQAFNTDEKFNSTDFTGKIEAWAGATAGWSFFGLFGGDAGVKGSLGKSYSKGGRATDGEREIESSSSSTGDSSQRGMQRGGREGFGFTTSDAEALSKVFTEADVSRIGNSITKTHSSINSYTEQKEAGERYAETNKHMKGSTVHMSMTRADSEAVKTNYAANVLEYQQAAEAMRVGVDNEGAAIKAGVGSKQKATAGAATHTPSDFGYGLGFAQFGSFENKEELKSFWASHGLSVQEGIEEAKGAVITDFGNRSQGQANRSLLQDDNRLYLDKMAGRISDFLTGGTEKKITDLNQKRQEHLNGQGSEYVKAAEGAKGAGEAGMNYLNRMNALQDSFINGEINERQLRSEGGDIFKEIAADKSITKETGNINSTDAVNGFVGDSLIQKDMQPLVNEHNRLSEVVGAAKNIQGFKHDGQIYTPVGFVEPTDNGRGGQIVYQNGSTGEVYGFSADGSGITKVDNYTRSEVIENLHNKGYVDFDDVMNNFVRK